MRTKSTRGRLMTSTIIFGAAALAMSSAGVAAQTVPNGSPTTETPSGSSPQVNSIDPSQANSPAATIGIPASAGRPATQTGGTVSEVTVTGSRIRQPNLTSTSPLTVVNAQELKLQGTTNVEALLNNLPQVTADQTSAQSNGSSGTATVNLRNLGSSRTLVLVDGRRLEPSASGSPDLNNVPSALVDRVDVVTGGASAVYGADAVAGVVNFILKRNFQGLRIDAQVGFDNHENGNKDAAQYLANAPYLSGPISKPGDIGAEGFREEVTAIIGANSPDDRGNVTAYASYRHLDPVLQASYDYSACTVGTTGDTYNLHVCNGSSNTAYGRFDNTGAINPATGRGTRSRANNPDGSKTFVPYSAALSYNFGPANYLQRQDDTYRAGFFGNYKLNEKLDVYADFMFLDDNTNAQIAPSGFFSNSGPFLGTGYTFNCNNPLIGPAQAAALCPGAVITPGAPGGATTTQSIRYRFASTPRDSDFRHTDYKIDLGARGDLGQGWHYDAYLQYGTSLLNEAIKNYASEFNLQNALNVINDPVTGKPRCVTNDPRCVPLDIFASLGRNFTPAALAYVLVPSFTEGQAVEQIAHADISGDLGQYGIKSPFANDGLGVAAGTEYRREFLRTNYDNEQHTADLSGGGGQALDVSGSYDVYELFGEARMPLVQDRPFIKDLSIDGGYRFSDYSTSGITNTYKGELNYSPTSDIRFRFSYNRAVRAPTVVALFTPQVAGLGGFQDPCAGTSPSFTAAQCALTGLSPALYGTGAVQPCASSQCEILSGGNPNLQPEKADTFSVGLVFTPTFFRGFTASVDYFNIDIQNVIDSGAGPTTILNFCAQGNTAYCGLIKRDAQGSINSASGYVYQTNTNSGSLATRGVDFTASYRLNFADLPLPYIATVPGSLQFGFVGTYVQNNTFQPVPKQGHYDCAGLFGPTCGDPQPKFRSQLRTTWVTPWNMTFSLNWRYFGGVKLDYNDPNPFLNGNGDGSILDVAEGKIPDYNYFDLSATYRFRDRYTFRAGVNNLFDKDPPIIESNTFGISSPGNFGNANTFPGVYDALGRTIFVGVTADF